MPPRQVGRRTGLPGRTASSAAAPRRSSGRSAPVGDVATEVLTLQRYAGNVAVAGLLGQFHAGYRRPLSATLQRQPAPTGQAPLTEGMTEADAKDLAEGVLRDYHDFYNRLMQANTIASFTHYRQKLMQELDAIAPRIYRALERGVFEKPLQHMEEIITIHEKTAAVEIKLSNEHQDAKRLLTWLEGEVAKERTALSGGSFTDQTSLDILTRAYDKAKGRVAGLGNLAVSEDVAHVVDMVKQKSHRKRGVGEAARDEQRMEAEREAFMEEIEALESDDEPGILGKVWSVFGWDSWKDFKKDVALAIVTLGYSKYARSAKRTKRAMDLAKKARMARKLKYAKKLEQFKKVQGAAERLLQAVEHHHAEITNILSWVKANAASIARKILTDLASDVPTGGVKGATSVAIDRVEKGYIQAQVDDLLNVSEEQGKKYAELAVLAFAGGKRDSGQRMLRAFLSVSGHRRALTNIIFSVMRRLGRLDFPENWASAGLQAATVANTTAFEVIQDFVMGIPHVDKFKKQLEGPIEAARKFFQKLVQGVIG